MNELKSFNSQKKSFGITDGLVLGDRDPQNIVVTTASNDPCQPSRMTEGDTVLIDTSDKTLTHNGIYAMKQHDYVVFRQIVRDGDRWRIHSTTRGEEIKSMGVIGRAFRLMRWL